MQEKLDKLIGQSIRVIQFTSITFQIDGILSKDNIYDIYTVCNLHGCFCSFQFHRINRITGNTIYVV